ncbi:thymidine phosphorylase domain protein [Mycobacterium kansasii 824]|nr:thymidine phosphorylase domain protein [Mycobacterium kansasii 824]
MECLSTVGSRRSAKSIRVPEASIADVHLAVSPESMPRQKIAISKADICSGATRPSVKAWITQSMAASDNRPPSRLVRITVGASNSKSVKRIPRADRVDGGAARPTGRQIRFGCFVVCLVPQQLPTAHRRARDRGYLARRTPRAAVLVEYPGFADRHGG